MRRRATYSKYLIGINVLEWKRESHFYERLRAILNYLKNKYFAFNIILGGDFNINILDYSDSKDFLNLMAEYNFTQHIKKRTRLTKCIDLIFTNYEKNVVSTDAKEFGFCDHKGVIIKLKTCEPNKNIIWNINKRLFNTNNISKFKEQLKEIN